MREKKCLVNSHNAVNITGALNNNTVTKPNDKMLCGLAGLAPMKQNEHLNPRDCCCCCLFGFNVAFNNFSVISRLCLVATWTSMLTFIVLPH